MQITKELLDTEIAQMQAQLKEVEASANKLAGAVITLQDLRRYMDKEEPPDTTTISEENAAIQARDEAAMALSLQEFAELVAGPGAVAEEPVAIDDIPYYPDPYYDDGVTY